MEFSGIGVDGGAHPRLPEAGPDRRVRAKCMGEVDESFRLNDVVGIVKRSLRPQRQDPQERSQTHGRRNTNRCCRGAHTPGGL